jgi:hypothetical protein
VGDDGAEDTSDVTVGSKESVNEKRERDKSNEPSGGGDTELLELVVVRTGLADGVVDGLDGSLERL